MVRKIIKVAYFTDPGVSSLVHITFAWTCAILLGDLPKDPWHMVVRTGEEDRAPFVSKKLPHTGEKLSQKRDSANYIHVVANGVLNAHHLLWHTFQKNKGP